MPFGRAAHLAASFIGPFGREVIYAIEIELAVVLLLSKCGVGEVYVIRLALPTIPLGALRRLPSHRSASTGFSHARIDAGYAPRPRLAGVETALRIERVAAGPVRVRSKHFRLMAGRPLDEPVRGKIAENQVIAHWRPGQALCGVVFRGGAPI